jgi:SAM-dependent methyltransferase
MPLDPATESRYYRSREFDPDHARDVRKHYVKFVDGRRFLVDLGCGRGEFLELARDAVERVKGVDADPGMVGRVRDLGIEVEASDALDYVRLTTDRPDVVFAAHLVEHLSVEQTADLLGGLGKIIPRDGIVILVTPNPACLAILTADFWSDPTHVRLYTVELLRFLLEEAGFEFLEADANPLDLPGPPPHLLAASLLGSWGTLEDVLDAPPTVPGRYPRLSKLANRGTLAALRSLATELWGLRRIAVTLDKRILELRHQIHHILERHNDAQRFLYPPNEIYVVARRQ